MTIPNRSALPVRTPEDLLAVLPYLIGYTPTDSLVCLALADTKVIFVARIDLPSPAGPADAENDGAGTSVPGRRGPSGDEPDLYQSEAHQIVASLAAVTAAQNPTGVVLVGYGSRDRATPILELATRVYTGAGLEVKETLRVSDGRFFHDNCTGGCPSEGTPFDPASSPAAAHAVFAGRVALPDRAAYAA
jgi:Domain of unknown function (DUF4192)